MSAIRGKNTGLELALRKALTEKGYRYRLYSSKVFGHPDILFPAEKIAVFCDSEFWHGYRFEENVAQLEKLTPFWLTKIRRNIARDKDVNETLKKQGYWVLRFWGQAIQKDLPAIIQEIEDAVAARRKVLDMKAAIKGRTTLAYIESGDSYLFLRRNKKSNDPNEGKCIGVGGHLEGNESPVAAMKREILEETGLSVTSYKYLGILDFLNDLYPPERMYLYKVTGFTGELRECDEGELFWVKKDEMMNLSLWEGDRAFLPLLDADIPTPFKMDLIYEGGELLRVDGPFLEAKKKKTPAKRKRKKR